MASERYHPFRGLALLGERGTGAQSAGVRVKDKGQSQAKKAVTRGDEVAAEKA